jgi:transcriptional regulator with XRE-family HTH domain
VGVGSVIPMLNIALAARRRVALNLTYAQLGEQIGVSRQVVQRWEAGRAEPRSIDTLRRYAKALGVEVSDLVAEPDPERAASP